MPSPRLATALAALAVLGGGASAEAGPKLPKALAGVALHDGATKVEIDSSVERVGGRAVIAFRTQYKSEVVADEATITESGTELAIIDGATRDYLLRERIKASYRIARHGYEDIAGSFEYRVSWKDEDDDGDPELSLRLGKASGAGAPVPDARRVWQVRYGALAEVGPEIASCPRGHDDAGTLGGDEDEWAAMRVAAVERFVDAVDLGKRRAAVRCAYGDALVAARIAVTDALLPASGHDVVSAPVAVDCPGHDWAARHGLAGEPRRAFVFLTARGLAIVTVQGRADRGGADVLYQMACKGGHEPSCVP